jgi:hypothetical protein
MRQMGFLRGDLAPKKELEDFNFRFNKSYNVDNIAHAVQKFSSEWLVNTSRQNMVYSGRTNPHVHTQTFIVQDHSLQWDFGTEINAIVNDQNIFDLVSPIVKDLESICGGTSGRILLINLESNQEVPEHTDKGDYLSTVKRFHIPIITNDNVYYTVNGETINMKQGECWEINNLKPHSVLNNSSIDRVHLLIDIFPDSGNQ